MQAIEFETVVENHQIQVPDVVPNGIRVRVILLWEPSSESEITLKELFASATDGLASDDLERPQDM